MLDKADTAVGTKPSGTHFDVAIAAVATAVPPHSSSQAEVARLAQQFYPQFSYLEAIYANAGVETRYWCEPAEWYLQPHDWEERTAAFKHHALPLLARVTLEAIDKAGLELASIDAVVTNTITGLAVPSLDALLMNRLGFSRHAERLPIFGFGCAGGVAGLSRAARLAQSFTGGNVLFLTIDLCSLCLRLNDPSMAMFVSGALFGDGAAAVVLRNTAVGDPESGVGPRVVAVGEHFWNDSERIMGWDIRNDGFGIVLSSHVPAFLREHLRGAVDEFLDRAGLTRADLDGYLFHPGGAKIMDVADQTLSLPEGATALSREILRDYGNMSSATALFILSHAMQRQFSGRHLLASFGPGFSVYFAVVDF